MQWEGTHLVIWTDIVPPSQAIAHIHDAWNCYHSLQSPNDVCLPLLHLFVWCLAPIHGRDASLVQIIFHSLCKRVNVDK